MEQINVERRLKSDLEEKGVTTFIDVVKEGPIGERVYEVCVWDWKVRLTPDAQYPFKTPKIQYCRPGSDQWQIYQFTDGGSSALTLEGYAMQTIYNVQYD